jgi:hypothetical protein
MKVHQELDGQCFACQELVLADDVAEVERERIRLRVRLPLNVAPMQAVGTQGEHDHPKQAAGPACAKGDDMPGEDDDAESVEQRRAQRIERRRREGETAREFRFAAIRSFSRRLFDVYFLPVVFALISATSKLWPSYVPDWLGYAACGLLFVPYLIDRYFDWFEFWSRPVAGVCYIILAGLAVARGLEDRDFVRVGVGAVIALMGAFVAWEDEIRSGNYRRIPVKNLFLAALVAIAGFATASNSWNLAWTRVAIAIATAATAVAYVFLHAAVRYCGATLCLLVAVAGAYESLRVDPDWMPASLLMAGAAYAFLRGDAEPARNRMPDDDHD